MPSFRSTNDKNRMVKRVMQTVHDGLLRAYGFRAKSEGLDQAKLAERLGIDKAIVSRRLAGATNLTERTLGEMCWALGHELQLKFVPIENSVKGNAANDVGFSYRFDNDIPAPSASSNFTVGAVGNEVTGGAA